MIDKVKEVRERSNAPLGDCKTALTDAGGDVEKALVLLQERGAAKAVARGGRIAAEGKVFSYIHAGKIGVLVEVNCETDFVARNPAFEKFCSDVAMQIAAMNAQYVRREDVPENVRKTQAGIFESQLVGKAPPQAFPKIIEGKFTKWYSEVCLMEQEFVTTGAEGKPPTVEQARAALVASLGENVQVRRFVRWEVGEGVEKRSTDLAGEVAKLTGE